MDHETTQADTALLTKVRKLLDKATATANEHEAEAFSRKAAELIARHRIDPDHLERASARGELGIRDIALGRGAYVRARLALLMAVAEAHDAQVVFTAGPTGTVAHVAGFVDDLDVIEMMYQSLHAQAGTHMAAVRRSTAAATQRFRRSFLFGFAARIAAILETAQSEALTTVRSASTAAATDLALRRREARVEDFATQTFGRVRAARPASAAQVGGWQAGAAAADGADVGRARLAGRRAIGGGGG